MSSTYYGSVAGEIADDGPDTNKILGDIDEATAQVRDFLRDIGLNPGDPGSGVGPVFTGKMANAVERLLDQWAYLRHCIESEHAPLPGPWALASQVNSPLGDLCEQAWQLLYRAVPAEDGNSDRWYDEQRQFRARWFAVLAGADPEPEAEQVDRPAGWDAAWEQYRHLQAAADAVQADLGMATAAVQLNPGLPDGFAEFIARAEHLVACVSAVDAMCKTGDLPAQWGLPFWRRRVIESVTWQDGLMAKADEMGLDPRDERVGVALADPRVTANGGAAAKAGWDLAVGRPLGWAEAMRRAAVAMEAADRTALQPQESAQHIDRARAWMQLARQSGELT